MYLDHGGTTIYAKSLIEQFSQNMINNLYGNPHSNSDPARLSGDVVDSTREAALAFFGADPEHFELIFTANATAAIKLVAESFSDLASSGTKEGTFFYGYHRDAHTSLVGVRELTNGTNHCFASDQEVEEWLEGGHSLSQDKHIAGLPGLFAFPGQSNMTGRRLPLSWPKTLRQSLHHQNTYSLLDAAALATTAKLDLSDPDSAPDFTALSFYKIFGFPDLGALIVRKRSGHILSWRRYFGGGTVNMVTVHNHPSVQRKETLHEVLEDGTLPFHSIVALSCALNVHRDLFGSMNKISQHTSFLSHRLQTGMARLRHPNGRPICTVYNDSQDGLPNANPKTQGATMALNVMRENGTYIAHSEVEKSANEVGIFVRSGGLCNAGGIAHHLKIEPWQFKRNWSAGFRCGGAPDGKNSINVQPTGVVRVSLGAMSVISDVDTFLDFMEITYITNPVSTETLVGRVCLPTTSGASRSSDQSHTEEWTDVHQPDSGFQSRDSMASSIEPPSVRPALKASKSLAMLGLEPERAPIRPSHFRDHSWDNSRSTTIRGTLSNITRPLQVTDPSFLNTQVEPEEDTTHRKYLGFERPMRTPETQLPSRHAEMTNLTIGQELDPLYENEYITGTRGLAMDGPRAKQLKAKPSRFKLWGSTKK